MIWRAGFLAILLAPPVWAEPEVTVRYEFYDVSARSADALRAEMRRKGPKGYWGYTGWQINWSGACQVTLTTTITLPRHTNPDALSADMAEKWSRMLGAMTTHEEQHAAHSLDAAREIDRTGCQNPNGVLDKLRKTDRAFDLRTDHGRLDWVDLR